MKLIKYKFELNEKVDVSRYILVGKVVSRRFVLLDLTTLSFCGKLYEVDLGDDIIGEFPESDLEKTAEEVYYKQLI